MIKFSKIPKFTKTLEFFDKIVRFDPISVLHEHGRMGVKALSKATPRDTGDTAGAWSYKIDGNPKQYVLTWTNDVVAGSAPLVLLLQYGHGTKSGYFIPGQDFINPALKPVYASFGKAIGAEVHS